jgi:Tetratricopeptide repeat
VGTLTDVAVLSREAFDAIESDAAATGDHLSAAQQMTLLADTGTQTAAMPRAEAYLRAGEQWLLADDPAAAANRFMRAMEDGGPSFADPRVPLARALFLMGRATEAETLLRQLSAEPPRDARMCDMVAELLLELSDLRGALAWASAGVELCLGRLPAPVSTDVGEDTPDDRAWAASADGPSADAWKGTPDGRVWAGADGAPAASAEGTSADGTSVTPPAVPAGDLTELRLLLTLRFRIRNDLGLPQDAYDLLLDELPSEPGATSGLPGETTSASAASSRFTLTMSPSAISPDNSSRAS